MGLWLSTGLLALAPQESADLPLAKSTDKARRPRSAMATQSCSLFVRGRVNCKMVRGPDGAGAAVEGVQCSALDTVSRSRSNPTQP